MKWLTLVKPEKNACPTSALFQCSLIGSDAADAAAADHKATPPPPVIRPPNAAADHHFVGAQLYLLCNLLLLIMIIQSFRNCIVYAIFEPSSLTVKSTISENFPLDETAFQMVRENIAGVHGAVVGIAQERMSDF